MRIAIYDPDVSARNLLAAQLKEVFYPYGVVTYIEQYGNAEELLCEIQQGSGFDVVFLEADLSGRCVALMLRRMCFGGKTVLTSSVSDFAVDGYEAGVCGYLLKPYQHERLIALAERLAERENPCVLTVSHRRALVCVPLHTIVYIESSNTKCIIHRLIGESYVVYRRLDDLEREIDDPRFLRCHQSFLVNMDHVVKANRCFEMIDGSIVNIRQRDHRRLRDQYLMYRRSRNLETLTLK